MTQDDTLIVEFTTQLLAMAVISAVIYAISGLRFRTLIASQ